MQRPRTPLRSIAGLLCTAAALGLVPVAFAAAPLRLFTTAHPAMGTGFTLYLYSADPATAASASQDVFDEIDRIEQLLSNYRDTSELSRINQNAAAGPVTTDPETFDFLTQSQHWSQVSDGAFDITVGRLMKAYGFFRHQGRVPSEAELTDLRAVTGWQKMQLDPAARTVFFTAPGIELDPGGIGKGFAVDAAVRVLRAHHITAALLSAGSSTLYALGAPPHKPGWRIVIPALKGTGVSPYVEGSTKRGVLTLEDTLSVITLRDTSLSSADCSQKNFTLGGHLYCHIMDPHTLRPVEGRIQVSIVNPSATASDALSNVIFVQTPQQSLATLQAFAPDSRALIVSGSQAHAHCTTYHWTGTLRATHCARSAQGAL
jgi:thiamine biosynthesis lipoprotein